MSVLENVAYGLRVRGRERTIAAPRAEMLELVQLGGLAIAARRSCPAASASALRWRAP